MTTYTGYKTLYDYLTKENMDDGVYSLDLNGEVIDIELYNFYNDVIYTDTPTLGDDIPDKRMLVLKYHGDLTINSDVIVTPQVRKKGMTIFVQGTLTNNGVITMTARGAIAQGQDVYLYENKDGSLEYVPSIGALVTGYPANNSYVNGNNGSKRSTGSGGSGGKHINTGSGNAGRGGAGTSYSGGCGGGAICIHNNGNANGTDGSSSGGLGGSGRAIQSSPYFKVAGGGTGNPGGDGHVNPSKSNTFSTITGTGGLLILYVNRLINNGTISSNGSNSGYVMSSKEDSYVWGASGGASGGGSINIFYAASANTGKITVLGGYGYQSDVKGGDGGNGTVTIQKISIRLSLIKSDNKIYILQNNMLIGISLTEPPTKSDFEKYGMIDLSIISKEQWDELGDFEILTWTNSDEHKIKSSSSKLELDNNYTGDEKLFKCSLDDITKINNIKFKR